jgi:hypothetical protein
VAEKNDYCLKFMIQIFDSDKFILMSCSEWIFQISSASVLHFAEQNDLATMIVTFDLSGID